MEMAILLILLNNVGILFMTFCYLLNRLFKISFLKIGNDFSGDEFS